MKNDCSTYNSCSICADTGEHPAPTPKEPYKMVVCKCQQKEIYRAHIEILLGDRLVSNFLASAGLGITGCGVREILTIDYEPGEEVDVARVSKMMDFMIEESDRTNTPFKILSYRVLNLELVNKEGEKHNDTSFLAGTVPGGHTARGQDS